MSAANATSPTGGAQGALGDQESTRTLLKKEIAVQKAGFASEYLQLAQTNQKLQWQVHNSKVHNMIVLMVLVFVIGGLLYSYLTITARFEPIIKAVDSVRSPNGAYQGPSGLAIAYAYTYPWYNNNFITDTGNRNWPFAVVHAYSTPVFANILLADKSGAMLETMFQWANDNNSASADDIICKSGPFNHLTTCEPYCKPTGDGGWRGFVNGMIGGASQAGTFASPFFFVPGAWTPAGGIILGIGAVWGLVNHIFSQQQCEKSEKYCRKSAASRC